MKKIIIFLSLLLLIVYVFKNLFFSQNTVYLLPTIYKEERFIAQPITVDGTSLRLLVDTAGGLGIRNGLVKKLNLQTTKKDNQLWAFLPKFKQTDSIPTIKITNNSMYVLSESEENDLPENIDGILGPSWFADRIWHFNYPGHQFAL